MQAQYPSGPDKHPTSGTIPMRNAPLLLSITGALVLACSTVIAVPVQPWIIGNLDISKTDKASPTLQRAVDLIRKGETDAAEEAFNEVLAADPESAEAYLGLAEIRLRKADLEGAGTYARKAIDAKPDSAGIWVSYGNVQVLQGRLPEAEAAYQKAIRLHDFYLPAYMAYGDLLQRKLKKPQQAIEMYQKAVAIDGNRASSRFALATAYATVGDMPNAELALREAARLAPADPLPRHTLGRLLAAQQKFDAAVEQFSAALEVKPDFQPALLDRADVLAEIQRNEEAVRDYRAILEKQPDDAQLNLKLALVTQRTGDMAAATRQYKRTLALNPNMALAYNNLAWIGLQTGGDLEQADAWARQAVRLAAKVPQFHDTLGWITRARGKPREALRHLQTAAGLEPPQAAVHYHMGVIHQEMGNRNAAATAFKRALQIDATFADAADANKRLAALSAN